MNKILLGDNVDESKSTNHEIEADHNQRPNIFNGRPETDGENSKFPDWDIIPPTQFINPRIKK